MTERGRLQRKRQRLREDQRNGLPLATGVMDRPSSVADGGPTGAVDRIVAESTQAAATPNALLNSAATADLVQGTMAQVVGRALEQAPPGHRFSDIDVLPRTDESDGDAAGRTHDSVEHTRHVDDPTASNGVTDTEPAAEEQENEQAEAGEAQGEVVESFEENASFTSSRHTKERATPSAPPPDAGGNASSQREGATESPRARPAEPGEALAEAVDDVSALEVERPESAEQSSDKAVDVGVEEIDADTIEGVVEVESVGGKDVEEIAEVGATAGAGETESVAEAGGGGEAKSAGGPGAATKGKSGGVAGGKGGAARGGSGAGGKAGGAGRKGGAGGGGGGGGGGGAGGGGGGGARAGGAAPGGSRASPTQLAPAAADAPAAANLPALPTSSVALIDEELVEHQRWGGAQGAVGAAGSLDRAAFVVDTAGGAALSGLASGAAMGLGIGLAVRATSFIPGLGGAIGGVMALHGLSQKIEHWDQTAETIGKFGEGNSTYETLANSIAAVGEIVDIVSQVLNTINGVVGVLTLICYGITAAGAIATIATLGAAAPILAAAAEMSVVLTEIEEGITAVTTVLDIINAAVLQPAVLLFRAMHTFTSQADPREVEASGGQIAQAAAAWGGTLGAKAGGALAEVGGGGGAHADDENSATQHAASDAEPHPTAPAAGGGAGAAGPEGPVVHFEAPSGGAAVDPHAPTNLDIPAAHADTVPVAIPGGGTVDVNAPTHVDSPAAHADTVPVAVPGGGTVDVNAPTHVDSPAAHADTVPMAAPEPGVSPLATTGEIPAPGVSPLATTGEVPVPGVSPMATTGEVPVPGVSPMAHSEVPGAPPAGAVDPHGQTAVDPFGQTAPGTAPGPGGPAPNEPVPGGPGGPGGSGGGGGPPEPPPNAELGGVPGWPPHDPYPGDQAPMLERLAWGARQYEPGGQWHSEPLPPVAAPAPAPEPAPWVGPPRNPVMEMTPVNPAEVYPGAPQPPGFQAGPVGSLGTPEVPTSGAPAPAAPALPGQRNPVMEMTPVNPADVYPGAPQPPGFQAGPVGSLDLPPATPMPATLPQTHVDVPAAHAPTNLDIPAAHAPTNLDIPAVHAPTQPVDVVPAAPTTLPGIGPEPSGSGTLPGIGPAPSPIEPVQTGQTLPGIGPEPVIVSGPPNGGGGGTTGGGGGGGEPPSSAPGGGSGGGGPPDPLANLSPAEIDAALNAPGHSDLLLSAPAPAAPTRFSDASNAEIEAAIDSGARQAERRGRVDGQPANLSENYQNLSPAEQAALITDPGTVRPGPDVPQPGPGGSRYNISNGMMVNEVTIRAQSGRPGETGDVPTVIRVHTPDLDPTLPANSNSATGNTVSITQGNQGPRGQGVRMVPTVDADGNPVQTWHPTATASDEVMNASHIPIHRDPAGGVPPQTGGTLPGIGPPPNGGTPPAAAGGGGRTGPDDLTGMRFEHVGTPNGELAHIDPDADVEALFGPLGPAGQPPEHIPSNLRSDTYLEAPGQNPRTGEGLQTVPAKEAGRPGDASLVRTNEDPNRIAYNENMYFSGVGEARIATHADVNAAREAGNVPGAGESVIPTGVGRGAAVPATTVNRPDGTSVGGNLEVRAHSANPNAPPGSHSNEDWSMQLNTPGKGYGWMGDEKNVPTGAVNRYLHEDAQFVPLKTKAQKAKFGPGTHFPIGTFEPPASGTPGPGAPPPTSGTPGALSSITLPTGATGAAPSRTPTLPGIGPATSTIQRPGSLGSVPRVASDAARASVVPTQTIGTPSAGQPQAGPSTAQQVGQMFLPQLFGPEGEQPAPTHDQRVATHNAHFTGDNQAPEGVERVNPAYPPPPGTPEQLTQIQTEITNLLAARAQTERSEQHMAGQEAKHRAGEAPIQQAITDTTAGTAASRAHEQSVARHAAANQEQQQRQQQGGGLVSGYPSRAAGLAALTVPLGVFEGFTRFASILPGDAGAAMARMNADARRMEDSFAQMTATMLSQDQAQPARQAELQGDQQRLQTTNAQSADSSSQLVEATQGAQDLQRANQEKLTAATQAKQEAATQKTELGDAAAQKTEQAQTLSTQLDAWAPAHKGARDEAVRETEQRLQQEGYVVRPSNT